MTRIFTVVFGVGGGAYRLEKALGILICWGDELLMQNLFSFVLQQMLEG